MGCDEMSGFTLHEETEGTWKRSEDETVVGAYSYSLQDGPLDVIPESPYTHLGE